MLVMAAVMAEQVARLAETVMTLTAVVVAQVVTLVTVASVVMTEVVAEVEVDFDNNTVAV
jgi:hypothetical protein